MCACQVKQDLSPGSALGTNEEQAYSPNMAKIDMEINVKVILKKLDTIQ